MLLYNPRRVAILAGLAGLLVAGGFRFTLEAQQPPAGRSLTAAPHLALVDEYCVLCHDDVSKAAGLSLEAVAADDVAKHPDVWEKVVRKLRTRQMPPIGQARPDDTT